VRNSLESLQKEKSPLKKIRGIMGLPANWEQYPLLFLLQRMTKCAGVFVIVSIFFRKLYFSRLVAGS
jgi:hypothetical protein